MTTSYVCPTCQQDQPTSRALYLHRSNVHGYRGSQPVQPTTASKTKRQKISQVGERTDAGLACPKCGSTQFKAKRTAFGKAAAITTIGVGAVLVPKRQVRCVACGTTYKRG